MIRLSRPRLWPALSVFGWLLLPTLVMAETATLESSGTASALPGMAADNTEAVAGRIADSMEGRTVKSVEGLEALFRREQTRYLWMAPPLAGFTNRQDCGVVVFDPKTFPEDFSKGLIGEIKYGCPVYSLAISEDPISHDTIFSNADGGEIARLKPEEGYNPYWLLEWHYPELYTGLYSSWKIEALQAAYDPSRIQITVSLLPADYVNQYALAMAEEKSKQAASLAKVAKDNPPMMRYQSSGMTNIELVAITVATNGMKLTLAYPDDFTNRVDIFTCADLVASWWDLGLDATNVNTSTNWIEWVDTSSLSQSLRFYATGNADFDSDSDGLSDAREQFMYHTCATNSDSDGDGLGDYYEIMTSHTDPNNSDTNKPSVWISFPTSGSREVWLP